MPSYQITSRQSHLRGWVYDIAVAGRTLRVIVTSHAMERLSLWWRTEEQMFETLLFPEEAVSGHRRRFIAHRRYDGHVLRVVYEYETGIPLIVTVYFPYAKRYFQGGGTYADQVLP